MTPALANSIIEYVDAVAEREKLSRKGLAEQQLEYSDRWMTRSAIARAEIRRWAEAEEKEKKKNEST